MIPTPTLNILTTAALAASLLAPATASAANERIEVCHVTGQGSFLRLEVNINALDAHLDHGDHLPYATYADADGDGYGDPDTMSEECELDEGRVANGDDCDDDDADLHPDALDTILDGIDQDCDGADAFAAVECADDASVLAASPGAVDGSEGACTVTLAGGATFTVDGPAHVVRLDAFYYLVPGHGTSFSYEHDPAGDPADETFVTLCDADCATGIHIVPVGTTLDGASEGMGEWDVTFTEGEFEVDGFEDGDPLGSGDAGATEPLGDKAAGEAMGVATAGDDPEVDWDGDGFFPPEDCDDEDGDSYPGAPEVQDGRDNNCDGVGDADITPPQIHEVFVTPDPVVAGQAITITVDVTDDESDLDSVAVWGSSPSGASSFGANIWGVDEQGRWFGSVTIPENAEGGDWTVDVGAWDAVGNSVYAYDQVAFAVEAVEVDSQPPVIGPVQVDPEVVEAGETFVITVEVTDDLSGISSVSVHGSSPSGASGFGANIWGVDEQGRWYGTIGIAAGAEAGMWSIDVYAHDEAGNSLYLTDAGSVEVSSPFQDTDPPEIVAVWADRNCQGSATTLYVQTVDEASAIGSVAVWGRSPSGLHSFGANIWGVAGDVWHGQVTIPEGSETGWWTLDVMVYDEAGNPAYADDVATVLSTVASTDADDDGWAVCCTDDETGCDCNDEDPDTFPGAAEICDGVDSDCDGDADGSCWRDVSAGRDHACATRYDGDVHCWGADGGYGRVDSAPTTGTYAEVAAGRYHSCALADDGSVTCWGCEVSDYGQCDAPSGSFVQVSAGSLHSCGLREDGSIDCWGHNTWHQADDRTDEFLQVSAGADVTCAITAQEEPVCWGNNNYGRLNVPADAGGFLVSVGFTDVCSMVEDGEIACWGYYYGADHVIPGSFVDVSVGGDHGCAIQADGTPHCWGSDQYGQVSDAPSTTFDQIDAGYRFVCGVTTSGTLSCWGRNSSGQCNP